VGGEILASDIVRWLGGAQGAPFLIPVGSLELKGLAEPLPTVRVEWEPAPASTIPMPALLTDIGRIFVGRDAEFEWLEHLWKEVVAGERRVALLAGEPGVGKTRLAAELAIRVHEQGGIILAGRCDEDLGVPYQPFVEALRHFVDHTPPAELKERLGRYGGELGRLVPELAARVPDLQPPLQSDPETERYRLFDAVAAWLTAVAAEESLVLVLDDLQWAAKPTLLLLRHVVRSPDARRLLVLGTYRDSELTHDHLLLELVADLRRASVVERVLLSGLDDAAVAAFVEQAAGQALDGEGVALARAIYQETEGNPFFVREVLRHLAETRAIEESDGRWATKVPIDQLGIPEGIRDVVGRRLARLSEEANEALQVASVVGAEFEADVLQAAGQLPESALLGALDEAVQARLVTEVMSIRFRFAHALVRATLYESLTGPRKVALHRHVAEAIENLHEATLDDYLPALAHHWARASAPTADTAKAIDYAIRAGNRALAQLANDEAVGYYRQALDLLDAAQDELAQGQRLKLLIALGDAQKRAGDAAHRETLLEAGRLASEVDDAAASARAALVNQRGQFSRFGDVDAERVNALETALAAVGAGEASLRARLMAALANELYFADDNRRHALANEALTLARAARDPASLAEVLAAVWNARRGPGTAQYGSGLLTELAELAQRLHDPLLEFQAGMAIYSTGMQRGDLREADAGLDRCGRVAEELSQPVLRWRTRIALATRAVAAGRFSDAERMMEEALQLGTAAGQPDAEAYRAGGVAGLRFLQVRPEEAEAIIQPFSWSPFRAALAWSYAQLGRLADARAVIEEFRAIGLGKIPKDYVWLITCSFLTRACALAGDAESAAELYELLLPHRLEISCSQTVWAGPVAHDLAVLATTLGRYDDACANFSNAEETQVRIGALGSLVHTRLEWGRMLLVRGEPGDTVRARELLGQALGTARELGLTEVERDAVALLQ
jgi:hypothetical protein